MKIINEEPPKLDKKIYDESFIEMVEGCLVKDVN
jgi:hypothetical protein